MSQRAQFKPRAAMHVTKFDPNAAWRKHGTWRDPVKGDTTVKDRYAFDAFVARKVAPMGVHGLVIRKASAK